MVSTSLGRSEAAWSLLLRVPASTIFGQILPSSLGARSLIESAVH